MPKMTENGVDPGKPLFLTPYIKAGNVTQGDINVFAIYQTPQSFSIF